MKSILRAAVMFAVAGAFAMTGEIAHSYAYNPWTTMTGEKILAINPFVYTSSLKPFIINSDVYIAYGFTPNIDIMVNLADLTYTTNFSYNYSSVMLRYDFGGNNIVALQASQLSITPQYHFFWENDVVALEANVYGTFTYASLSTPTVGAYLAPVWKAVKDTFYAYCEVDPSYTVGGSFALHLVPGIWLGFGNAGQLSIGCDIGNVISGSLTPNVEAWYFIPIDFNAKK